MERKNIYIELLDRFMRGELPAEEEHELWTWFKQPGARELLFQHYRQSWTEAEGKELPVGIQNRCSGIFRAGYMQKQGGRKSKNQFESYSFAGGCHMPQLLYFF